MLQQTQVERVTTKFEQFIEAFPSLQALASASLREVLSVWQGLGYNRRARYLREACALIAQRHKGRLPRSYAGLRALPGIGHATAASILAFAYNEPVVFLETNIRTVFIHHFFKRAAAVRDADILPLVEQTLDRPHSRQWYYALMDYGVWLKRTRGNAARRSAHYSRQSRFEGSDRQLRGSILRRLLKRGNMRQDKLCSELKEDKKRFDRVVATLETDGLMRREKGFLCV